MLPAPFLKHLEKTVKSYWMRREILAGFMYHPDCSRRLARFPFSYSYLLRAQDVSPSTTHGVCSIIMGRLQAFERRYRALRRLKKMIVAWHRSGLRHGEIIARNIRNKMPDRIIPVAYHVARDAYFATAFSGRFPADMEGERYIIRVNKLMTSQDAIEIYCASRRKGKEKIHQYLSAATDTLAHFERVYRELDVLGEIFMDDVFSEKLNSFLMGYMNDTLYRLNGINSLERLRLFLDKNRVMAEYIWKANFATREQRGVLGSALKISNRNLAGFKASETVEDLNAFIDRKMSIGRTILDDLPPALWQKIQKAQADHEQAKKGESVGRFGRYISSDEIERTRNVLAMTWSEVDKWVAQRQKKT